MTKNNTTLISAKRKRNDEYYTKLEDIENELKYYKKFFKNKIVYCNADNPYKSNFVKYFINNFEELGLKRLISTQYNNDGKDSICLIR